VTGTFLYHLHAAGAIPGSLAARRGRNSQLFCARAFIEATRRWCRERGVDLTVSLNLGQSARVESGGMRRRDHSTSQEL
jgi:hypothetical protein